MASREYVKSCQAVQHTPLYRTDCNFLVAVAMGAIFYGVVETQWSPELEQTDDAATVNLIVSFLVRW